MSSVIPFVFFGVFLFVAGTFVVKMFRHGGFKAAMFGARIHRTVGEVAGGRRGLATITVTVHELEGDDERRVGLEIVGKTFASYQMFPVTLSASDARQLASLIESALPRYGRSR